MEQDYETIDLREVFAILKNNLLVIVASAVLCGLLGMLVTVFVITPQIRGQRYADRQQPQRHQHGGDFG